MARSSQERQAAHRRKLKVQGAHRTSIILSKQGVLTLRQLTAEHCVTQSDVIELGILAAANWLAGGKDDA